MMTNGLCVQICPSVNLAEKALVLDGNPRDLSEAEVTARAHDLWVNDSC